MLEEQRCRFGSSYSIQMKNLYPFQETFIANEELINLAMKACVSTDRFQIPFK